MTVRRRDFIIRTSRAKRDCRDDDATIILIIIITSVIIIIIINYDYCVIRG